MAEQHNPNVTRWFDLDRETDDTTAAESLYGYDDFDFNKSLLLFRILAAIKGRSIERRTVDVAQMAAFYLIRGTNINVLRRDTSFDGGSVKEIIDNYMLVTGRQPTDLLTLARVCMTFSSATVMVAIKVKDRLPVPHSRIQEMVPGYPAAMMATAFAALIPQGEPYTATIRDAHYLYIAELIKFVDPQMRPKPNWEVVDSFEGRASALERSHPMHEALRVESMQKWGILVGGVCSEAVTSAAELFKRYYRRPNPAADRNPAVPENK